MSLLFGLLNATWDIAVETSKYILLGVLIAGFSIQFRHKKRLKFFSEIQSSFKAVMVPLGQYIVFGIVFSGILNFFIKNTLISTIPLLFFLGLSYFSFKKGIKFPKISKLKDKILSYIFFSVLIISLFASLIFNTILINSIVALLLFGALFWEI